MNALELLRRVVAAKQAYWDEFLALEKAMTNNGEYTDRQNNAALDHIDNLAGGGEVENIGEAELNDFLRVVFITTATRPPVPRAAAAPVVPLTFHEFQEAYGNAMRQGGTAYTAADVDSSWESYRHDPAGHFISKHPLAPKFTIGQWVYVAVENRTGAPVEWSGQVERVNSTKVTGASQYEYYVSNAPLKGSGEFPLLAWESELKPMYAADGTMLNRDGNRSIFDDVDK